MKGSIVNLEVCGNRDIKLLFVGDPNLGAQGFEIVRTYFTNAVCAIWRRGDAAQAREIRKAILSSHWNVLLSFYNDLLFSEEDLKHPEISLNIHPASPCLRGVGYDSLPIILGHATHGVTLHHMVAEPDAGEIIDVIEEPLPNDLTSSELRLQNQRLCLKLLENVACGIHDARTTAQMRAILNTRAKGMKRQWNPNYISRARLNSILHALRRRRPGHRVFR